MYSCSESIICWKHQFKYNSRLVNHIIAAQIHYSWDRHKKLPTQRAGRGWHQVIWRKKISNGFLMAAQDQPLRTNVVKVKIDKQEGDVWYRMCKGRAEIVVHITGECSKLTQLEYKKRHDKIAWIVHWSLCEKHDLPCSEQWYRHMAGPVTEMEKIKIFCYVSRLHRRTTWLNTDNKTL